MLVYQIPLPPPPPLTLPLDVFESSICVSRRSEMIDRRRQIQLELTQLNDFGDKIPLNTEVVTAICLCYCNRIWVTDVANDEQDFEAL